MENLTEISYVKDMLLSTTITLEQHKMLKIAAAMQGNSIMDNVLERTLSHTDTKTAFSQL